MKKHRRQVLFSGIITAVGRTVWVLSNLTFFLQFNSFWEKNNLRMLEEYEN